MKMVVIGRPEEEEGMNFEEMSKFLQKELELDNHWKVTLVGIGAGARDQVTLEAKRCCQEAELLIGAGRMIEAVAEVGQTYMKHTARMRSFLISKKIRNMKM